MRSENLSMYCAGAALMLGCCMPAAATLGEDASTVPLDQAKLEAALEVADAGGYAVHLLRLPSGTVVRQYVSPSGMVFAVSWQGPVLPDLQQILGPYFAQYAAATKAQDIGPGSRRAEASGLVVQSSGHMRAFSGKAYLQQKLPRGVTAGDIQ